MNQLYRAIRHRIARYLLWRAYESAREARWLFLHYRDPLSHGHRLGELLLEFGKLWLDLATAFVVEPSSSANSCER